MASEKLNMIEQFKNLDILKVDRRTFLKAVAALGATSFVSLYGKQLASALSDFPETKVIWLHGSECTGCTISSLNASSPEFADTLAKLNINMAFHKTIMAPQGVFIDGELVGDSELNVKIKLDELVEAGDYILMVEGAIGNGPDGTGKIHIVGNQTFKEIYEKTARNAKAILAIGTCATYGGVTITNAATRDYCDFMGVNQTEHRRGGINRVLGINKPVINIPGCPVHPDRIFLTVAAILLGRVDINNLNDVLDRDGRLLAFHPRTHTVHDNCPRRGFFDRGILDVRFAEGGCVWKLGCKAPYVFNDCALRKWNAGASICMQVGGPCVACVEPIFPNGAMPYFVETQSAGVLFGINIGTVAALSVGAAIVAAGVHAVRRVNKEK